MFTVQELTVLTAEIFEMLILTPFSFVIDKKKSQNLNIIIVILYSYVSITISATNFSVAILTSFRGRVIYPVRTQFHARVIHPARTQFQERRGLGLYSYCYQNIGQAYQKRLKRH